MSSSRAVRGVAVFTLASLVVLAVMTWPRASHGWTEADKPFLVGTVGLGGLYVALLGLWWFRSTQPIATGMAVGMSFSVFGMAGSLFGIMLGGGAMLSGAGVALYKGLAEAIARDPELRACALLALVQVVLAACAAGSIRSFPRGNRTLVLLVLGFALAIAGVGTVLLNGAMTWSTS